MPKAADPVRLRRKLKLVSDRKEVRMTSKTIFSMAAVKHLRSLVRTRDRANRKSMEALSTEFHITAQRKPLPELRNKLHHTEKRIENYSKTLDRSPDTSERLLVLTLLNYTNEINALRTPVGASEVRPQTDIANVNDLRLKTSQQTSSKKASQCTQTTKTRHAFKLN